MVSGFDVVKEVKQLSQVEVRASNEGPKLVMYDWVPGLLSSSSSRLRTFC